MTGRDRRDDQPMPGLQITCAEIVELVTDYLEGALDDDVRVEIEAHLELCESCQVYLEQMRATIATLGHVPVETLTPEARTDLLAAFRSYRRPGTATT